MRIFILIALTASLASAACSRKVTTWIGAGPGAAIDAEFVLDKALARAAVENKAVFVHLSAPG